MNKIFAPVSPNRKLIHCSVIASAKRLHRVQCKIYCVAIYFLSYTAAGAL